MDKDTIIEKKCEVCEKPLPSDFGNNLCMEHYQSLEKEIDLKKEEEIEERKQMEDSPINEKNIRTVQPVVHGVLDKNYQTNPEMEDKDQAYTNIAQFVYSKKLLWYPTRNMYNAIRNFCKDKALNHPQYPKFIWKPHVVDVGCGSGVGTNVLSHEASFAWGIDKNELSIRFCNEAFKREKNGIYYSPQVTFDVIDIVKDNREFMKFDVVAAIEIFEHIAETDIFLNSLKRFAKHDKRGNYDIPELTTFFISTPNRNNEKIRKDKPQNPYHVFELTAQEFCKKLREHFKYVSLFNQKGEPVSESTNETPIMAKCMIPINEVV